MDEQWTFNPSAPWEALARGAGFAGEEEFEFEEVAFADDDEAGGSSDAGLSSGSSGAARKNPPPSDDGSSAEEETNSVTLRSSAVADRAAAFAASLAGGDISGTFDEGDFSPSPGSSRDGERPSGVGATTVFSSEGSSEETEEDAELVATRRRMEARLASLLRLPSATSLACDVVDGVEASALMQSTDGVRLRGVVHAAGVVRDMLVRSMTMSDVSFVFAPKAVGAEERRS